MSAPKINITFKIEDKNDIENIVHDVKKNDASVFWYFGSNGLKQNCVNFYKPYLTKILKNGGNTFLVDLSAWSAFRKGGKYLNTFSSKSKVIQSESINVLKCSDFFSSLQREEGERLTIIQKICQRESLLNPSKEFKDVGFKIKDIFNENCKSLITLYNKDCAKTYSVIQYIEFLYFVDMILQKFPKTSKIRFILPNDEAKYYLSSMEKDLNCFIEASQNLQGQNFCEDLSISIH